MCTIILHRKAHEKIAELQCELEFSRDREVTAHQQLSEVIRRAERIKAEKDALAKIVRTMYAYIMVILVVKPVYLLYSLTVIGPATLFKLMDIKMLPGKTKKTF